MLKIVISHILYQHTAVSIHVAQRT